MHVRKARSVMCALSMQLGETVTALNGTEADGKGKFVELSCEALLEVGTVWDTL